MAEQSAHGGSPQPSSTPLTDEINPLAPGVRVPVQPEHPALAQPKPTRHGPGSGNAPPAQGTISQLAASGVPAVALQAYRNTATGLQASDPSCHLSWALLAAIGRVESDQGQYGGAALLADGDESQPIIGPVLDGRGRGIARIADTDQGRLDGDATFDRAVGPMQFLPGTWAVVGIDADGNGVADPQNIFDAAASAGRYLCADGADLATPAGQDAAVLRYNQSQPYAALVLALMHAYARGVSVDNLPKAAHPIAPRKAVTPPKIGQPHRSAEPRRHSRHPARHTPTPTKEPTKPPTIKPPTTQPPKSEPPTTQPPKSGPPTTQPPTKPPPPTPITPAPLRAPSAPLDVHTDQLATTTGAQLELEWRQPAQPGSGIAGYKVTVRGSNGAAVGSPLTVPAKTDHIDVPKLPDGGLYTLSVTAFAARGQQQVSSQPTSFVVATLLPASVQAADADGTVTVTWDWADAAAAVMKPSGYVVRLLNADGAAVGKDVVVDDPAAVKATVPTGTATGTLSVEVWAVFTTKAGTAGSSEAETVAVTAAPPSSTPTPTPTPTPSTSRSASPSR